MRSGEFARSTKETRVRASVTIEGTGKAEIRTGIGFLSHLLSLLSYHGLFDIFVEAEGDREVDDHHIVEDIGICLGEAFSRALGDRSGIKRFGWASIPMDETLVHVALDLSGRDYLVYNVDLEDPWTGDFDTRLLEDFLMAFSRHIGANIHVDKVRGRSPHHVAEALFKALGISLDMATAKEERRSEIPSTKGVIV
jgi:imidazoleglycerol-phosphate dehydratase